MLAPVTQITVLVSIRPGNQVLEVRYSYTDPVSGQPVTDSTACIISAQPPYHTLFALDFPSTQAGWTFVDATPKPGATVPSYSLGSNRLTLCTYNDGSTDYRFNLTFRNTLNMGTIEDDPQENNLPRPKSP